jgi:hypothetical protein
MTSPPPGIKEKRFLYTPLSAFSNRKYKEIKKTAKVKT